jgi:hypothetical protein
MRRSSLLLAFGLVLALLAGGASGSRAATGARCPATFTVLHNDRVGAVSIPRGSYFLNANGLSCATASSLLSRFLDDFDGSLPGGWTTAATGRGFVNATTHASLTLTTASNPGPRGSCPGTFTIQHNDRIGSLRLRAGRYAITTRGLSCLAAQRRLAFFLFHDFAGTLPRGWRLDVATRRFSHGRASFSVKLVSRHGTSGGGGVHPNPAITCPGTVTLAAGTAVGSLVLPAGRYYVNVFSNLSCSGATAAFVRFAAAGAAPPQWVVVPDTGTFLRGKEGFQVEPVA